MVNGIVHIDNFLVDNTAVYNYLLAKADWDDSMAARKTASYGVAYNYSQMSYPYKPMLSVLESICSDINQVIGFMPNNCLLNYYPDGRSKMGFHSDQTDILVEGTGVVIVSLGTIRTLRFKNIENQAIIEDFHLAPGSLFYMTQQVQHHWQHAIMRSDTAQGRISLTMRRIV